MTHRNPLHPTGRLFAIVAFVWPWTTAAALILLFLDAMSGVGHLPRFLTVNVTTTVLSVVALEFVTAAVAVTKRQLYRDLLHHDVGEP
mgnify:CR=1 FL=1